MVTFFTTIMDKPHRIKKNEEFQQIIKLKKAISNSTFVIYYDDKKETDARAGISVSKKMGNAVERNKIKRQLRMMIKETIDLKDYPLDIIVITKKHFLDNSYADNKKMLEKLLKKVTII